MNELKNAPLTAAASRQTTQLSGTKKTKENLLGTKTTQEQPFTQIAHATALTPGWVIGILRLCGFLVSPAVVAPL
jgi:hypothetical protein